MSTTQATRKRARSVARGWQCALTILLAVFLNGCPPPADQPSNDEQLNGGDVTDQGTADDQSDGSAAVDGSATKPDRLRVFGTKLGPPNYELRWTYTGVSSPQSFTVYESDVALPAGDPSKVIATPSGTARTASIQIRSATGQRHVRVEAVTDATASTETGAGMLSAEYIVDTTMRLAFVVTDREHGDGQAVYVATPDSGGEPVCITGPTPAKSDAGWAVWSPDGRFVATVGDYESAGTFEVYVAAGDGSSFTAVSGPLSGPGDVNGLVTGIAWSPDALRLAYDAEADSYVVEPNSPVPIRVGHRVVSFSGPNWSPDAEHLAYVADPNETGVFELYVTPADGGTAPTKLSGALVAGGNVQNRPVWSPDGQWLAFLADKDVDELIELYVVPAAGGAEPTKVSGPVVAGAAGIDWSSVPVWSPDGTRLAYAADAEIPGNHNSAYYITAPIPDGAPTKASGSLDVCGAPPPPVWSPDGTHLAFTAAVWPNCVEVVYVVSPGQEPVLVSATVGGGATQSLPFYSPDGTRVAFTCDAGLFVVAADGSGAPLKVSGAALSARAIQGPPFWPADGTRLAFVADADTHDDARLWVTQADGSSEPADASGSVITENTRVREAAAAWSRLSN